MFSTTYTLLSFLIVTLAYSFPSAADDNESNQQQPETRLWSACQLWYLSQPDPSAALAKTATPPCKIPTTFPSTLSTGWSIDPGCDASKQPDTCDLHQGAYTCYRHALAATGPGAQACYDQNGQFISDPWKGAGTLDVQTPIGDLIQQALHATDDVVPYYVCCKTELIFQPQTCNLYYEKRPPGQCAGELTA